MMMMMMKREKKKFEFGEKKNYQEESGINCY